MPLIRDVGVAGSNPVTPTNKNKRLDRIGCVPATPCESLGTHPGHEIFLAPECDRWLERIEPASGRLGLEFLTQALEQHRLLLVARIAVIPKMLPGFGRLIEHICPELGGTASVARAGWSDRRRVARNKRRE